MVRAFAVFALAVFAGSWLPAQVAEGPEPNDSVATATTLGCGAQALGVLANANDADWYRLVLTAPAVLRCETGPGAGGEIGDTTLVLLDAGGAPLAANDDGVGVGYYSRLTTKTLAAGTWFVAVHAGPQALASGSYSFDVRCTASTLVAPTTIVNEGVEPNDPRLGGTATTVLPTVRCNGILSSTGGGGDYDFYRVILFGETFLQARVSATATHPTTPRADDPVLYLFDGSSPPQLLAGPFRGTTYGLDDAAFDLRLPGGIYHVAVRGYEGSIAGRYYLDLHQSLGASATTHAGGCGGRTLGLRATAVGPGAPMGLERPVLGTTYELFGSGLGAFGITLHVVGFQATNVDLTPFGAVGCTLEVVWVDLPGQLADALGQTTFVVTLPDSVSLLGATLESQLAVLDGSNPLGVTLSNRVSAVAGN
ncbi:MAG: hypothetical protein K8J09_13515 [Planctomycetes bacterium]|nr:hypothetical protein [Planctomycetota bacterium]MCC7396339.1 PPC domain-containing protein [Planctomycetota bacterium]